ncbi:MAG: carboxyvinyl-carboxyphosphonate phosphorylmutase, partial [Cyanobacteriota bacterium]|nr:carboxyvinyl-carboxyphosphonate phosphorylmutase [Cyanobacteriota bacterium]
RMVNMLEGGITPLLPPKRLEAMGFRIAAYPLTLLSSAAAAMQKALADLSAGVPPSPSLGFSSLRELVGFQAYDAFVEHYASPPPPH